jgi:4'-phosphopantetheinyl transferase
VVWSVRLDEPWVAAHAMALSAAERAGLEHGARTPREVRRGLAKALLAHLAGAAVELAPAAGGAVAVVSPTCWHVSVSGRGTRALIGVAHEPIGVDLEPLTPEPPAWGALTPAERTVITALPAADRPHAFLIRWAAKEAHAKRTGLASQADPQAIETIPHSDGTIEARWRGASRCDWREHGGAIECVALALSAATVSA